LDFSNPILRATLTVTHPNFGRLLGNRLVREDTDPNTAATLDVTGHGTTGSLDLTCSQTTTANSLETEVTEADLGATGGDIRVAALLFLAILSARRLQHFSLLLRLGSAISLGGCLPHALDRGLGIAFRLAIGGLARSAAGRALVISGFRGGSDGLFVLAQHFALEDPHLDTDDAVGGRGFRGCVVDVGTQGVQRHTTFAIPLGTSDFGTVQTTRRHDLDALGTEAHGVLHGALHGATEHDALLELLSDRVGDQLSIDFRLADFFDVHMDGHAHALLQIGLQVFDILALLADDDARTGAVHG